MINHFEAVNDYRNYLSHHGILGMHWGIRRYQNEDGSYTKKGLDRLRKAKTDYEQTKKDYKKGLVSKTDLKAKKKNLKKSRLGLAHDFSADKGRTAYAKGSRILKNRKNMIKTDLALAAAASLTPVFLGNIKGSVNTKYGSVKIAAIATATVTAGIQATNAILYAKNRLQNERLIEYYEHKDTQVTKRRNN